MVRMSAEDRREGVIRAAMIEFAHGGYFGTSTEAIARRVGVSQPYLFRLFPGKKAIFLAAVDRCVQDFKNLFLDVSRDLEGMEAEEAMGHAYLEMITEHPERLLMQMQMQIAVAAAEAGGDDEVGEVVRAGWSEIWDVVHLAIGADVEQTTKFLAHGMLINSVVAMGFPAEHRVWSGITDSLVGEGACGAPSGEATGGAVTGTAAGDAQAVTG